MFDIGDRVSCLCGGKVSRLEGVAGKWMPGTIKKVRLDGLIVVELDHRCQETSASFSFGINGVFEVSAVRRL
jgi:hypothetical protein